MATQVLISLTTVGCSLDSGEVGIRTVAEAGCGLLVGDSKDFAQVGILMKID